MRATPPEPSLPASDASPKAGAAATFYRYRDAQGRLVIVDNPSRIPQSARASAERVELSAAPAATTLPTPTELVRDVHWPSFAAGGACAVAVTLVVLALRRRARRFVRLALLGGVIALGAGLYFGWARRLAGQGGGLVSSPQTLIEDAKTAVEKMNDRSREQERVLKELENER